MHIARLVIRERQSTDCSIVFHAVKSGKDWLKWADRLEIAFWNGYQTVLKQAKKRVPEPLRQFPGDIRVWLDFCGPEKVF